MSCVYCKNFLKIFIDFSVDSLAPFVHLIHLIAQDVGVKEMLSKSLKNTSSTSSIPTTVITKDDLPQVIF